MATSPSKVQSAYDAFLDRELVASEALEDYDVAFDPDTREAELEQAAKGRVIVRGEPLRILLDLDTPEARAQYDSMLPIVRRYWTIDDISEWKSSGGNTHIAIRFRDTPELSVVERLLLQSILGSDPLKELLSFRRYLNGVEDPTVLFQPRKKTQ